jgi:hypothetical protein
VGGQLTRDESLVNNESALQCRVGFELCYPGVHDRKWKNRSQNFKNFDKAEAATDDFHRSLTGNERLAILVELLSHETEQGLERVYRIVKLSPR